MRITPSLENKRDNISCSVNEKVTRKTSMLEISDENLSESIKRNVDENEMFKLGALVAIGELFDDGLLGNKDEASPRLREFLNTFGITDFCDVIDSGLRGPYLYSYMTIYNTDL